MKRGWAFSLGVAALSLMLPCIEACYFIVDSSAEQCESNGDCDARGGAFAGSVCTKDHVCLTSCTTNKGCIDAIGAPAICVRESAKCAPLLSVDCTEVLQADPTTIEKDSAVVLGLMLAKSGLDQAGDAPRIKSVELARQQITKANNGVPGGANGASRPLVIVSCDDAVDPVRAARHLAEVVRVPAIIGPAFSGVTTTVAKEVTIPRGVLIISPSATSPSLTSLVDNGLVWRTAPSDVLQAKAMTQLISKSVEPAIRMANALAESDNIRLAVVHKGDTYGAGLGSALFNSVKFNRGQSAADNDANYLQIDYGDPLVVPADAQSAAYKKAVTDVIAFKPHILVTIGTAEAVTDIFAGIEKDWTGTPRPVHIVSDGLQSPELIKLIGGNDELRRRVLGTIGEANGPTFNEFRNQYKLAFGTDTVPDAYAAGAYDATMLLAYAIAGSGTKPLKGALLNENLKRTAIPSAMLIEAGPSSINDGFKAMAGSGIDYNGASGPLDFNPDTGEAEGNIQVWCVKSGGAFSPSGTIFDAKQGALLPVPTGSMISCP